MLPAQDYRIEVDHPVSVAGAGHEPAELDLTPGRPDYVTTEGIPVWIERKHQKTRFLDDAGEQVGPVHANLVPAIVWALAEGWRDPGAPAWLQDGAIAEVRAGGAPRQEGQR